MVAGVLPVRISLFGQPRVIAADNSREFSLPRKTLNVMAYLILRCRRPTMRDSVAYALFPDDDEETARGHLRRNLSYLLSSLPPTPHDKRFVLSDFEQIAWNATAAAEVDVLSFDDAVAENRDDDAIALHGGDLLPTLYDDWTTGERERRRDAFHESLARTVGRDRSLRRFERAAGAAHRLLDDDPWREDIVRQLIAIRYEAGDRAGALAAFERFASRLQAEMHIEPMPETLAIRDAVLRGIRLASSEPASRQPQPEVSPALSLPFVGRATAMESGLRLWHTAADGRANVLFISGQAGIGKSRFTAELARSIEREGGAAVRGETAPGGEHRPYEAFVEALRNAAPLRGRAPSNDKKNIWQHVLDELLEEYALATFVDDRAARVRLFESVRRGFSDIARVRPAAIILEDLHWAGAATIDLLEFVSTRLGKEQILIVATFRNDELPTAHPLRALRRQLLSRGTASELELGALDAADVNAAARTAVPLAEEETLGRAVARSAGVPLLLQEALQDIVSGREPSNGGIELLFKSRLGRLSSDAEIALLYGAIIGARFDLTALAAATGWSDEQLVDGLRESIELGLIRASAGTPGLAFAFTHHLAHAAAVERLSSEELEVAHALVARALASLPQGHGARSAEIARHYQAAGNAGKAAEYFLQAARYALDVFANEEARETASVGLSLIDTSDAAQATLRHDFLTIRERALARTGAIPERRADALELYTLSENDPPRACAALERVFDAHRDDKNMRSETLARLQALASVTDRGRATFERTRSAHAFLEDDFLTSRDAALRASIALEQLGDQRGAFFAWAQYINSLCRLGDFKNAEEQIAKSRPAYATSEDASIRMEFHRVASSALLGKPPEIGLRDARQSLDLALRVGDRFAEARAHQNTAMYLGKTNEYAEALREHERALDGYRDVGDVSGCAATIVNLATVRAFCGDDQRAEALFRELPDAATEKPWNAMRIMLTRAALAMRSNRLGDAERHLSAARKLTTRLKTQLYAAHVAARYGELCARTKRDEEARTFLDEALTGLLQLEQRALTMETRALFARFTAGVGDFDSARAHAAQAAALAEGFPIQHFAEHAWHLAAAHSLLGDDGLARHFAEVAARAFVDEAMRMDADMAEAYSHLPWHRHIIAYLSGRSVPMRLSESEE